MEQQNYKLEAALSYRARGIAVIPVRLSGKNKVPIIPWTEFQGRLPSEEEIKGWWKRWPKAEVGAVTGKISNLAVIDFEKDAKPLNLPDTVTAQSGGGGIHKYFQYPKQRTLKSFVKVWPLTDIRADGGIIVMPPSGHWSGGTYKWLKGFEEIELAEFPEYLLDLIEEKRNAPALAAKVTGVPDGFRNDSAASMAGTLLRNYPPKDWEPFCWPLLQGWNEKNAPPLAETELRKTFDSVQRLETGRRNLSPQNSSPFSEPENPSKFEAALWQDFCRQSDPPEQWRVEGVIPIEGLGILASPAGEKKTWLAMSMAASIANGTPFLNYFPVTPGRVWYIEDEMPKRELRRRGRQLGLDNTKEKVWLTKLDSMHMNSQYAASQIIDFIKQNEIKMVFVDTFRAVAGGLKEEDAGEVRRFFNLYKPLKDMGVFMLFLDHTRKLTTFDGFEPKLDQIFGSQDKRGCVESILMIRSPDRSNEISVYHRRCRMAPEQEPFKAVMGNVTGEDDKTLTILNFAGAPDRAANKKAEAMEAILSILKDGERMRKELLEILQARNIHERTASEALRELDKTERIQTTKVSRENLYSIPSTAAKTNTDT